MDNNISEMEYNTSPDPSGSQSKESKDVQNEIIVSSQSEEEDYDTLSGEFGSNSEIPSSNSQTEKQKSISKFIGFPVSDGLSNRSFTLDTRFFPEGIKPGHIVEIKGPENSGKTFLLTYFLACVVTQNPTTTIVLIDTSHQFSTRNLAFIICHLDKEINLDFKDSSLEVMQMLEMSEKLNDYMKRIFVIKCYTADEYLLTLMPEEGSLLGRMISNDPNLSLVAVDCVDTFSFTESGDLSYGDEIQEYNILDLLKKAGENCRIPIICTTIMRSDHYARHRNYTFSTDEPKPYFRNIIIDSSFFTHALTLIPATEAEKEKVQRAEKDKNAHYATAYLRSRHKANIAGSVANHRVKFSIFSDMLWLDKNEQVLNC